MSADDQGGGGLPGLDLDKLLRTAREMAGKLGAVQQELAGITVEGSAGGGLVTAVANGRGELVDIHIDAAAVDAEDLTLLRDLIRAAVNQALARSREEAEQRTRSLTGGISIPGITP